MKTNPSVKRSFNDRLLGIYLTSFGIVILTGLFFRRILKKIVSFFTFFKSEKLEVCGEIIEINENEVDLMVSLSGGSMDLTSNPFYYSPITIKVKEIVVKIRANNGDLLSVGFNLTMDLFKEMNLKIKNRIRWYCTKRFYDTELHFEKVI